ncbi:hypothetical protein WJX77_010113 [Trebouxia sp. C0004]
MPGTEADTCVTSDCANCGENGDLLRCSRCHAAYFCSAKCQKAYWPFHRLSCHKNEFANAVEEAEPKFAGWMRSHGKLAVLKDDEIERLERAGAATMGVSRAEVMDLMYNRLEPKPKEPSYKAEELAAMRLSHETVANQAYSLSQHQLAWQQIQPAGYLGQDCATYKWSQSQTEVDVYVQIPTQIRRHEIVVQCTPDKLLIKLGEKVILNGQLYSQIKREDSMWLLENSILHLGMLKRNRRGNYANQCTNADTCWKSVLKNAPLQEKLTLAYPPDKYYALPFEGCDSSHLPLRLASSHAASQRQLVGRCVQAHHQQ